MEFDLPSNDKERELFLRALANTARIANRPNTPLIVLG